MESQSGSKQRHKLKNNKKSSNKTKTPKKVRKSEGPTCSMFLADLTRKLQMKRKHEADVEMSKNIVHAIIDTISSALPITFFKKSIEKVEIPRVNIEQLQTLAPELVPRDTITIPNTAKPEENVHKCEYQVNEVSEILFSNNSSAPGALVPKMPVVTSDVMKPKPRVIGSMHDIAVNTGGDHDLASEISKHVETLKKISLIAEEFNQKTAKNLKEIVDSVKQDLTNKLEEIKSEQKKKLTSEMTLTTTERIAEDESLEINTIDDNID